MRTAPLVLALLLGTACAAPPKTGWQLDVYPQADLAACETGTDLSGPGARDVAIALDTSASTRDPSGADIDGDGEIHALGGDLSSLFSEGSPDSVLAAQVVAARAITSAPLGRTRLALVVSGGPPSVVGVSQAKLVTPLGQDRGALEAGLAEILAEGPGSPSSFAKPIRVALAELGRAGGAEEKLVLLVADVHAPVMGMKNGKVVRGEPETKDAVLEALELGVVVHTFGMDEALDHAEPHMLSRIASVTGGRYHRVPDPRRLHCALAEEIARPRP